VVAIYLTNLILNLMILVFFLSSLLLVRARWSWHRSA